MTAFISRLGRVTLLGMFAFALLGGFLFSAAQAATYGSSNEPTVSTTTPGPGGKLSMSGGGFRVGSTVQAIIHSAPVVLGSTTVNAAGEVTLQLTIPESFQAGSQHELVLQGVAPDGSARTLSRAVTLAGGSGQLAFTGAVVVPLIAVGGGLLLAGGFMATRGRARRRATAA